MHKEDSNSTMATLFPALYINGSVRRLKIEEFFLEFIVIRINKQNKIFFLESL